jgi:hypothetical protein
MSPLPQLTRLVVMGYLAGLFGIVAIQLLTGQIRTRYLLHGIRSDGTRYLSPERIQLLIFTLGAAFSYISDALRNPHPGIFPSVPESWVALLGGSHAIYLGGKSYFLMGWKPKAQDGDQGG